MTKEEEVKNVVESSVIDLSDLMTIPSDFEVLSKPKANISKALVEFMEQQDLTIRELAERVGMKHPQVVRVTRGNNYNIDTLLRLLDGLGLEIFIQKKQK